MINKITSLEIFKVDDFLSTSNFVTAVIINREYKGIGIVSIEEAKNEESSDRKLNMVYTFLGNYYVRPLKRTIIETINDIIDNKEYGECVGGVSYDNNIAREE